MIRSFVDLNHIVQGFNCSTGCRIDGYMKLYQSMCRASMGTRHKRPSDKALLQTQKLAALAEHEERRVFSLFIIRFVP
jgi:hypothetical protein